MNLFEIKYLFPLFLSVIFVKKKDCDNKQLIDNRLFVSILCHNYFAW